jgi:hypothetical protein
MPENQSNQLALFLSVPFGATWMKSSVSSISKLVRSRLSRAFFDRGESEVDSQGADFLIQNPCW